MRILAIDYGLKRIGLALSDCQRLLASPLPALQGYNNFEKDSQQLYEIAKEKQASLVLIGYPLHLDGSPSELSTLCEKLSKQLKERYSLEVKLYDERLTSKAADSFLKEQGLNRKKRQKKVDSLSACILLQNYLDTLNLV